jgi:hypothetical protein
MGCDSDRLCRSDDIRIPGQLRAHHHSDDDRVRDGRYHITGLVLGKTEVKNPSMATDRPSLLSPSRYLII